MEASIDKKKLRPGDLAPVTGVYLVTHEPRHREPHRVVVIRGEQLPTCRTCTVNARFEVLEATSHITHDWDFSGPQSLAIRPSGQQFDEFRMFHRFDVRLPLSITHQSGAATAIIRGQTSDLSAGGIGALVEEQLPSNQKVWVLTIDLGPDVEPIISNARLRYRNGPRHGFEFVKLGAEKREAIRLFIEKHLRPQTAAAS